MTVFDHIIAGNIPASFVHQDDICVAFLDIRPISMGHVLIVPRQSVATMAELEHDVQMHLWDVAQRIALAQQRSLGSGAQHFLMNDGPVANQSVPHVHLHVIPRYAADGWKTLRLLARNVAMLKIRPTENASARRQFDQVAQKIATAMSENSA